MKDTSNIFLFFKEPAFLFLGLESAVNKRSLLTRENWPAFGVKVEAGSGINQLYYCCSWWTNIASSSRFNMVVIEMIL